MKLAIALLSASLMVPAAAGAAEAQSRYNDARAMTYEECVRQQRNRQVAGALIGGILGAVVGAEIHDDRQDRARERRHVRHNSYRGHRGYRGQRGHRGRGHRGRHHRHHESGNDGAVVAGGALGAVAGAAIAGQSNCDRYFDRGYSRQSDYGYQQGGYDPYYDNRSNQNQDWRQSDRSGVRYENGRNDELIGSSSYDPYYDDRRAGSNDGYTQQRQARVYTAGGSCRWMNAGHSGQMYMCQGSDGVWRPSDQY
ncbi:MAG: hypothetical protein AAFX09_12965 [Pseudomonadota bacterium]